MGLIKDFFEYRRALKNPEPEERSYNGGLIYSTLSSYSNEKAMQLPAFFCGVQLLSNAIATLPKQVVSYDNDEKHLVEHPLWYILNVKPNQKYNPFNMFHDILEHVIVTGNAYVYIKRDKSLNVKELIPIETRFVQPMPQENGTVKYVVTGMNGAVDAINMLDFAMFRDEMFRGISLLKYAATTLKSSNNAEEASDNFFKSGAGLAGILKASQTLNKDQREQIRESWHEAFSSNKSRGIAILPQGLDFQAVSVNPEDAQLLDSRKFNVAEIARFLNINPILLHDLSEVSYSSMEAANLYFIQNSVRPYAEMIAAEMNLKLFKPSEVGRIGVTFDYTASLVANKEAEIQYYRGLLTNGLATPNEIRKKLGMASIPADEGGDSLYIQLSYGTLKDIYEGLYVKTSEPGQLKNDLKLNAKEDDEPKKDEPKKNKKDEKVKK